MSEIGVITEQGYALGVGLGYEVLSEEDKKKMKDEKSKTTTDKER